MTQPLPNDAQATVRINVGFSDTHIGPGRSFAVKKEKLCEVSAFFKNALKDHWREGQSNVVNLVDDHPTAVHLFVLWCEGESIKPTYSSSSQWVQRSSQEWGLRRSNTKSCLISLINAFLLSTKLQAPAFQDSIMAVLGGQTGQKLFQDLANCPANPPYQGSWTNFTPTDVVNNAFTYTSEGSPLPKVITTQLASLDGMMFDKIIEKEKVCRDFLQDIVSAVMERNDQFDTTPRKKSPVQ